MKKKISILTIVFLFFISTTGLPVFSHCCSEIGKSVSSVCEVCLDFEKCSFTCCIDEISEISREIETRQSKCCFDVFDYKKIEDDFFQTITSNLIPITSVVTELHLTSLDPQNKNKFSQQTNYDHPPPKFGKELLNTIHQLKLDLPVC